MNKYAVIVAGGSGVRMGNAEPKQFMLLRSKPILWHTLKLFLEVYDDLQLILVLPQNYIEKGKAIVADTGASGRIQIVTGGSTRYDSVKNGLQLVQQDAMVFVQDAVRCLPSIALIHACYELALQKGNAIPVIAATDSMRMQTGSVNYPLNREAVRIVQTPQTFSSTLLLKAFEQPFDPSFTDEATVVEKMGEAIHLLEGEAENIKITRPLDLLLAEKILEAREQQQ
jgi:2-C-methyl-D-erythritol 4-phosphate cytidylyltransferase